MQYCLKHLYDHRGRYEIVKGQISGEITLCKKETGELNFLEFFNLYNGNLHVCFRIPCLVLVLLFSYNRRVGFRIFLKTI